MAMKWPDRYPGRWSPTSADYPQGKFKNRSSPTAKDGSFCEMDWANDWAGFFGALLNGAGVVPNGSIDTALNSQLYEALRIGGYKQANVITATSTVLTAAQVGQAFLFSTASSTCQLPAASSVPAGGVFKIESSSGLTLSVAGGSLMQVGEVTQASLVIPAGTEITAICTGTAWWVFGTGALSKSNDFKASLGDPGYQILPSGLIIQWGHQTMNNLGTQTFPIPFTSIPYSVTTSVAQGASALIVGSDNWTVNGFTSYVYTPAAAGSSTTVSWVAIGS